MLYWSFLCSLFYCFVFVGASHSIFVLFCGLWHCQRPFTASAFKNSLSTCEYIIARLPKHSTNTYVLAKSLNSLINEVTDSAQTTKMGACHLAALWEGRTGREAGPECKWVASTIITLLEVIWSCLAIKSLPVILHFIYQHSWKHLNKITYQLIIAAILNVFWVLRWA